MGNTKSHFRKLSRRNSFNNSLSGPSESQMSESKSSTGGGGIASRSHSLASNATGTSDLSSRLSDSVSFSIKDLLPSLTIDQLYLVKYSWHLVSIDTSSVCMNFFHQLQRQFTPRIKKHLQIQKNKNQHNFAASTSSLHPGSYQPSQVVHEHISRKQSCNAHGQNKYVIPQGQLTQQALKLACCLDVVIASLTRNAKVKDEKIVEMLANNGHHFKAFLRIDHFYANNLVVSEISNTFCESLRQVLVQNGLNWSQELQDAWDSIFRILLYHLDGLSQDEDDKDMTW